MKPITIGGRRVPCRCCNRRNADRIYTYRGRSVTLCSTCLHWVSGLNLSFYKQPEATMIDFDRFPNLVGTPCPFDERYDDIIYDGEETHGIRARNWDCEYFTDSNGDTYLPVVQPFCWKKYKIKREE